MSSKTYCVVWDEMLNNGLNVDHQLASAGLDYLFYDVTTNPTPRENWVIAEKVRYFGHFYNALVDFSKTEHDVFIFNAGDVFSPDQAQFTKKTEFVFSRDSNIWMFAPFIVGDDSGGEVTKIAKSQMYEGFILTCFINGIWFALHRELALFMLKFYEWSLADGFFNFTDFISGWGLDMIYAAWTLYNNKKIYRDNMTMMQTPQSSSYNKDKAREEYKILLYKSKQFVKSIGYDDNLYTEILNRMHVKVHQSGPSVSIETMYPNHPNISEFKY
jgi:hypothetical protein